MVDPVIRAAEVARYEQIYATEPTYYMREGRRRPTVAALADVPSRGSLLDVSCGRGEMMAAARDLGFDPVMGTEAVARLTDGKTVLQAQANALPFEDQSFDVVTCFDVIEHLFRGDDRAACAEIRRIARKHVLITASNKASIWQGADLHVNKRPYDQWDGLFREWFPGAAVTWIRAVKGASELWRFDL